jgi:disulfide bond formation protein DsbB
MPYFFMMFSPSAIAFNCSGLYYSCMKMRFPLSGLSLRSLLLLSALASFLLLATALVGQYGFGLYPCHLCIYQRIPYALIIPIGLIGAFFVKSGRVKYALIVVCALLFLLDAVIAGYHTGVEQGVFTGPTSCSSNSSGEKTLEELRAEIMNAPLVSCSQAMIYVLGLSMAAWNMIAATIIFLSIIFILAKNRKIYAKSK